MRGCTRSIQILLSARHGKNLGRLLNKASSKFIPQEHEINGANTNEGGLSNQGEENGTKTEHASDGKETVDTTNVSNPDTDTSVSKVKAHGVCNEAYQPHSKGVPDWGT